jgi:hypothetical protein
MALTPEQQARLDQLNSMVIPSGAAANPANQAVLEQARMPNQDIAQQPLTAPNTLGDVEAFNRGTGMLSSVQPNQERTKITADDINEAFLSVPGMPAITEFAQAINKSVADTIDFLGPDAINSMLTIAGSEKRVPTANDALTFATGGQQDFMEPGVSRDAVRAGGDYATLALGFSQLLRKLPQMLPKFAETTGKSQIGVGMAEQMAKNVNPVMDTAMGGLGGAGAVYGKAAGDYFGPNAGAVGEAAGSILAPLSLGMATPILTNMFKNNGAGAAQLVADLDRFSVKEAGKILAAQLERENMTVDDAVKKFNSLGTDAIPADIGASFRAKLREAANVFPRIFDSASRQLFERNKRQPERIVSAFDDASETSMLDLGTETARLDEVFKPQVKALYDAAREKDLPLTKPILKMIEDSPTLSKAADIARNLLRDARARGETPGTIDFINYIKIALDDQINKLLQPDAETGKIANLVAMKSAMLKQVDELLPEYKIAREEFADLAQLKSAGEVGKNIFKLTESPVDFKAVVDAMNPAQLKLAKLGVKEAIIKKFNDSQETANTIKSMFGKRGAIQKAEYLWGDSKEGKAQFKRFQEALEIEMEYAFTKNEIVGNSTTTKQLVEVAGGQKNAALEALAEQMKNKQTWRDRIGNYLIELNKPKEVVKLAEPLETAGDFLFMEGLTGEEVRKRLTDAGTKDIQKILLETLDFAGIPDSVYSAPAVSIGASQLTDEYQRPELGVGEALQQTINE